MSSFDPNAAAASDSGIFGLPFTEREAALVYVPVPWEATTSYGGGTSNGPAAILEASRQVDLLDYDVLKPYEAGLFARLECADVRAWNDEAKAEAEKIIEVGGRLDGDAKLAKSLARVNELGGKLNEFVREQTASIFKAGKIPAIIGGDHSVPFGAFEAAAAAGGPFGILHFDAHSDTRLAYEGFTWSHASIMRNALERIPGIEKLVQVGIRDFCEEELEFCRSQNERVEIFFDRWISDQLFGGAYWSQLSQKIIAGLPNRVWVTFDIDGLDPTLCPGTGTPVPGGLGFNQACLLLVALARSGRKIIGIDLNEVAPSEGSEWDANVGARLLYKMTALTLATQGKARFRE